MKTLTTAILISATLALAPRPAAALPRSEWPNQLQTKLGGSIELWPARDFFGFASTFDGHVRVARNVVLDFDISWGYTSVDTGFASFDQAYLGNGMIGAHWARLLSPRFALYAGGGLGVPILADPSAENGIAASFGASIRAYDDAYRFISRALPVRGAFGLEARPVPVLFLRAEVSPVLFFALKGRDETEAFIGHSFEIEYRHRSGAGVGGRLQAVWMPTEVDKIQFATEPYFVYQPGDQGIYLRAGFLLALDENLGPAFSTNKLATVRFSIGYRF